MTKKKRKPVKSLDRIRYHHNEMLESWKFEILDSRGQVWLTSRTYLRKDSCVKSALKFARRHRPFHVESDKIK